MDKKERKETDEDTTVVGDAVVVGVDNCNSVTKKKCRTKLENLLKQKRPPTKTSVPYCFEKQKRTNKG